MSRTSLLLCTIIGIALGLTGCAKHTTDTLSSTITAQTPVHLTAAQDPDGDGDDKGYNYFPMTQAATHNKVFIFNPNYDAWAVYDENGNRVNTGKASGGRKFCPDEQKPCETLAGTFHVFRMKGADCKSSIYPLKTHGGAPMPYCMFFDPSGLAIHGSNELPNYNASHGCVRITPTAAKWLNEHFIQIGTTVIILPYKNG